MGNLVFQATLGGQVNLVGPNTASTYNLNVPTVNSTLATLAAQTFAGTQTISSGNLVFSGTSQFVSGDFSNATVASRTAFQSSTSNGSTGIYALPNGTSTAASWQATNAADPTNASKILIATNGSTDVQLVSGINGTGTYLPLTFYTSGAEKMRLDTSGNLGLGVTPGTWNSSLRALEIGGTGAILNFKGSSSISGAITFNARNDGSNWVYQNSSYAGKFDYNYDAAGRFTWGIASSGTAGNPITFTTAMTLDASGNLGVGTTSPGLRLDVQSGAAAQANFQQTGANSYGEIRVTGNSRGGQVEFMNGSTRLCGMYGDTSNNLIFVNGSGDTERARIDSSGNLLVGTTSTSGVGTSVLSNNGQCLIVQNTSTTSANTMTQFRNPNGIVGQIICTGSSTAYNTSSDYRLKEDVKPMTGALAKVAALKPVTYKWKVDGSDGEGFIAHELQAVVPDCVTGEKDAVDAEGNPVYQGIDTSFLVATLTAAIQELKAIVDAQAVEIAALKGQA